MPRPPKLPEREVFQRIESRLARYDRGPFQEQLARALACGPSKSAWRSLAKKNPAAWAQSVEKLAKVSGFAERTESLSLTMDPQQIARELVARHGPDKAALLLQAAGLPSGLVSGEVIEQAGAECQTTSDPRSADEVMTTMQGRLSDGTR